MAKCPECLAGKCRNCTGLALEGDDFVACACTHDGNVDGGPGTTPTPLTTHHIVLGGRHGKYQKG